MVFRAHTYAKKSARACTHTHFSSRIHRSRSPRLCVHTNKVCVARDECFAPCSSLIYCLLLLLFVLWRVRRVGGWLAPACAVPLSPRKEGITQSDDDRSSRVLLAVRLSLVCVYSSSSTAGFGGSGAGLAFFAAPLVAGGSGRSTSLATAAGFSASAVAASVAGAAAFASKVSLR